MTTGSARQDSARGIAHDRDHLWMTGKPVFYATAQKEENIPEGSLVVRATCDTIYVRVIWLIISALRRAHGLDQLDLVYKRSREESHHITTATLPKMFNPLKKVTRKTYAQKLFENWEALVKKTQGFTTERPRLPQELVDIIISYVYDAETLRSLSMTCRWCYFTAILYLHSSITTYNLRDPLECLKKEGTWYAGRKQWPEPLQGLHRFDFLQLVMRISILDKGLVGNYFTPEKLEGRTLLYFSALKNLQELRIDSLRLYSFVPNTEQHFGHFAPTLQTLALERPAGTWRQIVYFIGHFPNLQNLKLCQFYVISENAASLALVPPNNPPLRGWLTLEDVKGQGFVDVMVKLYGGLPFRCVSLSRVASMQRVLDACVNTLETLQLCTPGQNETDGLKSTLPRHKSLRTLELTAQSLQTPEEKTFKALTTFLATATCTPPLEIVIVYDDYFFQTTGIPRLDPPECRCALCIGRCWETYMRFGGIHEVWNFRLVLCAEVFGQTEGAMTTLRHIVKISRDRNPDSPLSKALVISRKPLI